MSASLMLGASGSSAQSQAVAYNAVPTAIKAGSFGMTAVDDIRLVGTQVTVKKDPSIIAGGDLTVESHQDTAHSNSSSVNGSVSVKFTPAGVPASGSLSMGGGKSSSDMAWVGEQSGFFPNDMLNVCIDQPKLARAT